MLIASKKHQQRLIHAAESAEVRLNTLEQHLNTLSNFAMLAAQGPRSEVDMKALAETLCSLGESAQWLKQQQRQVLAMLHTPLKEQAAYPHQAGYKADEPYAPVTA